jgi:hypothetical protein
MAKFSQEPILTASNQLNMIELSMNISLEPQISSIHYPKRVELKFKLVKYFLMQLNVKL